MQQQTVHAFRLPAACGWVSKEPWLVECKDTRPASRWLANSCMYSDARSLRSCDLMHDA